MRSALVRGAIAGSATALSFIWWSSIDIVWWIFVATAMVQSLVLAANSFHSYSSENPSVTRFRRVANCGGASASCLAMAGIFVLYHFVPTLDSWVAVLASASLFAAVLGYDVWLNLAVNRYGRRGPDHPDFGEDDSGDLVRPEPGD